MNAHRKILPEAAYRDGRAELLAKLSAAEIERTAAELQAALKEIDNDAVELARAAVSNVESKLRGLGVAWDESQRLTGLQQAADEAEARIEAADTVRGLVRKRAEAMRAIDNTVASLKSHIEALRKLDDLIIAALAPHKLALADDARAASAEWASFVGDIRDRAAERIYIEGALHAAGLGEWGIGVQFPGPMGDLDLLNTAKSNSILNAAERIASNED